MIVTNDDFGSHSYFNQFAVPWCADCFPGADGTLLPENISETNSTSKKLRKKPLGADYQPGEHTVICGRGKVCSMSTGNRYLKALMDYCLEPYSRAMNKADKSRIVTSIIDTIHAHPDGTFVRFQEGRWWEVDDAFAREKIGSLFRDALFSQYRSSTKAKMAKKRKDSGSSDIDILSSTLCEATSTPDSASLKMATPERDPNLAHSSKRASQISLDDSRGHEDHVALIAIREEGNRVPVIAHSTFTGFPRPLRGLNTPRLVSWSSSTSSDDSIQPFPGVFKPLPSTQVAQIVQLDFAQPDLPDDMMSELDALSHFLEDCF